MIEQQVFIKTGMGLETSAKSTSLTEEYINSHIKPFYSSLDLYYLEGKDSPGYKSLIPLPDGSIVIGTGAKLSGEPNSYIHNFILSPDYAEVASSVSAALLSSPEAFDAASPYLPTLKEIPGLTANSELLKKHFASLNISVAEYMSLLAAIFASVEQNKNVFIALPRNTSITEICAIMYGLYENLPFYIRRKTGFCTLFGETEIRPEINIYFIPADKIIVKKDHCNIESYNASRDYIFNLSKKSYYHLADLKENLAGDYLSMVSEAFVQKRSLTEFFEFSEEAGKNLPNEKMLSLRYFNDLAYIYRLKENEETLPQKTGRITIIFTELLRSGVKDKVFSFYSEFIHLYRRHIKQKGLLIPPEILKRLVINYDFCPDKQRDELYDLLTLDLDLCLKSSENDMLFMHIDALRGSQALYSKVLEMKMAPSTRLTTRYFTYLTEQRKTVHSLLEFADSVFSEMPQVSDNDIIRKMLCDKAMELYDTSGDRFEAVKYLEEKCAALVVKHPDNAELFSAIYRYALENYMLSLDVSELNWSKIEKFPLTDGETINEECTLKHKIALAAKEILALTDDVAMSFIHYDSFGFDNVRKNFADEENDGKASEDKLKSVLLRCLKERKEIPRRICYIILFYIFESKGSRIQNDFDSIFDFIEKELNILPFEFIEWYLSSRLFVAPMTKNGRIIRETFGVRADLTMLTAFYESIRKYFISHSSILAKERSMKKLKKEMDAVCLVHPDFKELTFEFRKVLSSIISENYSPFRRLINKIVSFKNFKFIVLITCIAVIIFGGVAIGGLITAHREGNDIIQTSSASSGDKIFAGRTSWSSYIKGKDGNYYPASGCIDKEAAPEVLDFSLSESLTVEFANEAGLVIDGISIASIASSENVVADVFVYDENNRKFSISISDYDTETGASLYSFAEPMCIKKIVLQKNKDSAGGSITISEINAYINK